MVVIFKDHGRTAFACDEPVAIEVERLERFLGMLVVARQRSHGTPGRVEDAAAAPPLNCPEITAVGVAPPDRLERFADACAPPVAQALTTAMFGPRAPVAMAMWPLIASG